MPPFRHVLHVDRENPRTLLYLYIYMRQHSSRETVPALRHVLHTDRENPRTLFHLYIAAVQLMKTVTALRHVFLAWDREQDFFIMCKPAHAKVGSPTPDLELLTTGNAANRANCSMKWVIYFNGSNKQMSGAAWETYHPCRRQVINRSARPLDWFSSDWGVAQ